MKTRYVEVPHHEIYAILKFAAFQTLATNEKGREVVWFRHNDHDKTKRYMIKCYSSVMWGEKTARAKGEDAIRVSVVDSTTRKGIWKGKKILRTGSVEEVQVRLYLRLREAYRWVTELLEQSQSTRGDRRRSA